MKIRHKKKLAKKPLQKFTLTFTETRSDQRSIRVFFSDWCRAIEESDKPLIYPIRMEHPDLIPCPDGAIELEVSFNFNTDIRTL